MSRDRPESVAFQAIARYNASIQSRFQVLVEAVMRLDARSSSSFAAEGEAQHGAPWKQIPY